VSCWRERERGEGEGEGEGREEGRGKKAGTQGELLEGGGRGRRPEGKEKGGIGPFAHPVPPATKR
jgi:hypothetical protein